MTREQPPPVPVESNCTLVLFNEEGIEGGGGVYCGYSGTSKFEYPAYRTPFIQRACSIAVENASAEIWSVTPLINQVGHKTHKHARIYARVLTWQVPASVQIEYKDEKNQSIGLHAKMLMDNTRTHKIIQDPTQY